METGDAIFRHAGNRRLLPTAFPRRHAPRRECPHKLSRRAITDDIVETLRSSVSTRTRPARLSESRYGLLDGAIG